MGLTIKGREARDKALSRTEPATTYRCIVIPVDDVAPVDLQELVEHIRDICPQPVEVCDLDDNAVAAWHRARHDRKLRAGRP